jgi:hypothetical protein
MSVAAGAVAQQISAPEPQTGIIVGTVVDVNGDPVPGSQVRLTPAAKEQRSREAGGN